ncbi:MAG: hypothetical protein AB1750_15635 [Chloroflexota bacterium]
MYEPANLPPAIETPATEEKPTPLGIAALVVGILSVLGICGTFGLSYFSRSADFQTAETFNTAVGLLAICSMGVSLLGVVLGIVGVVQKSPKKAMPIIGLVLSALALIVMCGIMLLGFAIMGSL